MSYLAELVGGPRCGELLTLVTARQKPDEYLVYALPPLRARNGNMTPRELVYKLNSVQAWLPDVKRCKYLIHK